MNKWFPLEKVWKNQCASVPNDKWSTQLSRQNGERTDAEHKLFSRINVGHRHYSSSGLKGQDSLMVLICGDGLSFLDVIAARWRTGRGDSATLHTDSSSGRSWYLHYQANRFRALLRVRLNEKNPHSTDSWHNGVGNIELKQKLNLESSIYQNVGNHERKMRTFTKSNILK